jgi:hypothetical protein
MRGLFTDVGRSRSYMKKALFIGALALLGALTIAGHAFAATPTFFNGFETDTTGWVDDSGTIARVSDGFVSASYASGISSAPDPSDPGLPRHHARLSRGSCGPDIGGGGLTVYCTGPFTRWGGYNAQWLGGYTTQVDVYLDAAYAQANPDSYGGNACLLTSASDPSCKGTRFDYTSAINNSSGSFLRDFGFTVGTGSSTLSPGCSGWVANAGTNVFRWGNAVWCRRPVHRHDGLVHVPAHVPGRERRSGRGHGHPAAGDEHVCRALADRLRRPDRERRL